jgi:hypothetical protein
MSCFYLARNRENSPAGSHRDQLIMHSDDLAVAYCDFGTLAHDNSSRLSRAEAGHIGVRRRRAQRPCMATAAGAGAVRRLGEDKVRVGWRCGTVTCHGPEDVASYALISVGAVMTDAVRVPCR